jgi:ATP synthase protein I
MDGPRQPRQVRSSMRLASLGVELAAGLGAAVLLGYWIDRRFGTSPWGLLICAVIGIVGGLYNVIRQAVQESKSPPEPGRDREGGGPSDQPDG